jgi:LPPG:FO 2-phospho-L-lactate transferase
LREREGPTAEQWEGEGLSWVKSAALYSPTPHPHPDPPPQAGEGKALPNAENWLDFQDYFVRLRCEPAISDLAFAGADAARPHAEFLAALADPRLRAIVICPSNPFISIDPILAVPGVRAALRESRAPVAAVSPIVAGQAVKGPTAKMMAELGLPVDAATPARHYRDFLDLYIADEADAVAVAGLDLPVVLTRTLMRSLADRDELARAVLAAAERAGK